MGYNHCVEDLLNELLELEHAGWRALCDSTGGRFYGNLMTVDGRMVLANGAVMSRTAVTDSLENVPPWSSYTIDDPAATMLSDDVAALVYTGTGHRDGGEDLKRPGFDDCFDLPPVWWSWVAGFGHAPEMKEIPRASCTPPELLRRVIDPIEGGRSVAEVAAMVEPTQQTIYAWWNRHLVDTGRRSGTPTIENSELLAARRRIAELEKELAATRRASPGRVQLIE